MVLDEHVGAGKRARPLRGVVPALATTLIMASCGMPGGANEAPEPPPATSSAKATSTAPNPAATGNTSATAAAGSAPPSTETSVPELLRFNATTLDGSSFSGADLAGEPAVFWFWAPWCPNCRAEAPTLKKAAARHADQVTFIGVAGQDDRSAMREFVRQHGLSGFEHLDDGSGKIWGNFGVTYQPSYAFVRADGSVEVVTHQLSESALNSRIAELSAE